MAAKNAAPQPAEATQEYVVLTSLVAHGDGHGPGAIVTLTAEQAEYPLSVKAIAPKAEQ